MIAAFFVPAVSFSQEISSPDENITDSTSDRRTLNVTDESFVPNDKHSKYKVYGMGGGFISARGRIMLGEDNQYASTNEAGLPRLFPADGYNIALETKLWAALMFKEESMLRAGGSVMFRYNDGRLYPIFHIDELYFKWRYPMGDIIIGRNICSTFDPMLFGGPLDGIQLNLNVPFLNFRSFMGYTGFLGLFHPYNNPYTITQYDRTYHEDSNLALLEPEYNFIFNAEQAMRFFFCTDFDIYLAGIHINPYFLMQIDMSEMRLDDRPNNINTINTFHLGLNNEGRIIDTLYYKINIVGMFGFNKDIPTGEINRLLSCAFTSQLRYTFTKAGHSTLMLGYAFGLGNQISDEDTNAFWADNYHRESNKFYYYGRFDGGYVLNPILSNIHSISFRYQVTPVDKDRVKLSLYAGIYQTFKFWSDAAISFKGFESDNAVVGTEFDFGLNVNCMPVFTFGLDFGVLIPENGVLTMPIFRGGMSFVWTI
jgi:hypothetical protein